MFLFVLYLSSGSSWLALVCSNSLGILNSFLWNSKWTFGDTTQSRRTFTITKFVIVYLVCMLVNEGLLQLFKQGGVSAVVGQIPAMIINTILSFLGHKF